MKKLDARASVLEAFGREWPRFFNTKKNRNHLRMRAACLKLLTVCESSHDVIAACAAMCFQPQINEWMAASANEYAGSDACEWDNAAYEKIPGIDHTSMWTGVKSGEPVLIFEPYHLNLSDLRRLVEYCNVDGCTAWIDGNSWHYSGRTIRVVLSRSRAQNITLSKEASMDGVVELYLGNDRRVVVYTTCTDEAAFRRIFSAAIRRVLSNTPGETWDWLDSAMSEYTEVCCKLRGYKSGVTEQRVLISGATHVEGLKKIGNAEEAAPEES